MSSSAIEIRLLEEYRDAVHTQMQTMSFNDVLEGRAEELAKRVAMYKRQLENCIRLGLEFDQRFHRADSYYMDAMLELCTKKHIDGVFGSSPDHILPKRAGRAIGLLDQAIQIQDDPHYRLRRAHLNCRVRHHYAAALKDLAYLLANHADDEETYLQARRMKDELEA